MKKFLKNQRELIALAIFLLVLAGLVQFAALPLLAKITAIKDEIEAGNITQSVKKQRLDELPKMKQQYEQIKDEQKQLDVLLGKEQTIVLIEKLEKIAQDTNNTIAIIIQEDSAQGKVDPAVAVLVDGLPSKDFLNLKISLTGDYDGVFKFVSSLETLQYYCDVVGVNFSRQTESSSTSAASASVPNNSGILDPFGAPSSVGKTVVGNTPTVVAKNMPKLSSTLNLVCYLKK